MNRVLILITVLSTLLLGITSVTAEDMWPTWKSLLPGFILKKDNAISVIEKAQDTRCPQQVSPGREGACRAAYDIGLAAVNMEKAQLRFIIAIAKLPPQQRDMLTSITSVDTYNKLNSDTVEMLNRTDNTFAVGTK